MVLKYETAYFCGYAKLPTTLPTNISNGMLTLGLKINLESGQIEDVSVTLLSKVAAEMVYSYFAGKNIIRDFDAMTEEVYYRHQGNAAKGIIKALGDIRRNYEEFMGKNAEYLRAEN